MADGEATLLLDGVDVESLTECVEGPVTWPYGGFTQRGEFPVFPGIDGAAYVEQPYGSTVLPFQVVLSAACSGDAGQGLRVALAGFRQACRPDLPVTLRRLWPDATYEEAPGKLLDITPTRPIKKVLPCLVQFTLLDLWHGPAEAVSPGVGTYALKGDTRTFAMLVTLDAGAARTITNTTNGYWFTFGATVPAGGVLVDVEARTATAITGGADLSASLSWGKKFPMRLEAGTNTLTASAGTFTISYQPAYL